MRMGSQEIGRGWRWKECLRDKKWGSEVVEGLEVCDSLSLWRLYFFIGMMSGKTCYFSLTSVIGFGGHLGVTIHLECLDEDS